MIWIEGDELDEMRSELSKLRSEAYGLREDAKRWRYARRILPASYIEDSNEKFIQWARSDSESENVKADAAIDKAIGEDA